MLVPWQSGRALCWDVTVLLFCPLAEPYVNGAACDTGAVAEFATSRKEEKYADVDGRYSPLFRINCDEDFGRSQQVSSYLCLVGGFLKSRGEATDYRSQFPVSALLHAGAALQRRLAAL